VNETFPISDLFHSDNGGVHLTSAPQHRSSRPPEASWNEAPWQVSAGDAPDRAGIPAFSTANWLGRRDENGRSLRTAALIDSIEAEGRARRGLWSKLRSIVSD